MKSNFNIELVTFKVIEELPNSWNENNYKELLDIMEYGDSSDLSLVELKEMCLLSLSDNEPDEAAKIVLEYIFKDRLNQGQIENLSHEMIDEKTWEEYAELSLHEQFFNINQLLFESYNGKFPHPEAVQLKVQITAKEKSGKELLENCTEANLIRILVQGMPENTLINRLFDEQIEGDEFKDAQDIIWQYKIESKSENTVIFDIISSSYWLQDLKYSENFEADLNIED